jgi:hypothetical protein
VRTIELRCGFKWLRLQPFKALAQARTIELRCGFKWLRLRSPSRPWLSAHD